MKITVNKDNVKIEEFDIVHEGEHRVNKCSFSFSEEYTEELVKKAIFTSQNSSVEVAIINNECNIPTEILKARNIVLLGVYAYKVVDDKLDLRYSPSPDAFKVNSGSYIEGANESEEITPSQFEQYMQAMNDGLNKVEESIKKMDSTTSAANDLVEDISQKLENGYFIGPEGTQGVQGVPGKDGVGITTITSGQSTVEEDKTITPITVNKTDGSSESFNVEAKNGINGQDGKDGVNGQDGLTPTIGDNGNWYLGDTDTGKPSRGEVGPSPDLSDYVKNTDYASYSKGGVIKTDAYSVETDSNGFLRGKILTKEQFVATGNSDIISKGTMENIKDDYVESSNPVITLNNTLDNLVRKNRVSDYIISLKDALKYKVFEFLVHGKVKQETTNGYNLLPYPYVAGNCSKTENGITFTDNGDGSVTVNGTASQNVDLLLYGERSGNSIYEIPGNYVSGGTQNVNVRVVSRFNSEYHLTADNTNGFTSIDKSTYSKGYVELQVKQGKTVNNEVIRPMLSNEPDVDWEPFTGGASPNPDYPQPITALSFGKITRCGKNLFDYNNLLENYRLDSNGNEFITDGYCLTNFINVKPNTTYYRNIGITIMESVCLYDSKKNFISRIVSGNAFTTTADTKFIRTDVASEKISTTQLEEGSVATDCEPYQATEYTIDLQGNEMVELPNGVRNKFMVDKEGNVSLIKNIGKVYLDGNSNEKVVGYGIATSIFADNLLGVVFNIVDSIASSNNKPLSNMFSTKVLSNESDRNNIDNVRFFEGIAHHSANSSQFVLSIKKSRLSNLNIQGVKSWLLENNVPVYYQLATPQTIPLGTLSELITTEEGSNTFFINGNLETTLEVLYARDSEKYLQQYIDDKLATLSQAIIEEG